MSANVLIYGAGVIGSVYAVRLAKAGHAVAVLARGQRLEAIRGSELTIRHVFLGETESAEVEAIERLDLGARYDMVLCALRSGQILEVLRDVARLPRPGAVVVLGNNLEDYDKQAATVGTDRLVLAFGSFGGLREGGTIAYLDGRTRKRPAATRHSPTTLGVLSSAAQPALDLALQVLRSSDLPCEISRDIRSWLLCHAALVFPLAGGIYAAAGEQARVCRTRDAVVLGVRAARELLQALRHLGYAIEPPRLRRLLAMPEPLLVGMLRKGLAGESARVAMFGHANASGGRAEIGGQAAVLDHIARRSGRPLPSWDRLLPYFREGSEAALVPDGSRSVRLRLW
jgi:2-dehydropantoate 2-reductase